MAAPDHTVLQVHPALRAVHAIQAPPSSARNTRAVHMHRYLEQVAKVVATVEGDPADIVVQHNAAAHQQLSKVLHINPARLILR